MCNRTMVKNQTSYTNNMYYINYKYFKQKTEKFT